MNVSPNSQSVFVSDKTMESPTSDPSHPLVLMSNRCALTGSAVTDFSRSIRLSGSSKTFPCGVGFPAWPSPAPPLSRCAGGIVFPSRIGCTHPDKATTSNPSNAGRHPLGPAQKQRTAISQRNFIFELNECPTHIFLINSWIWFQKFASNNRALPIAAASSLSSETTIAADAGCWLMVFSKSGPNRG